MANDSSPVLVTRNSWAARIADSVLQSYPPEQWRWHYEHGLVVKAIAEIGSICGDLRMARLDSLWLDHFVTSNGEIRTYHKEDFNLDQIYPGRLLFPIYRRSGDERYAQAIRLLASQLQEQPRNASGGFWHKRIYPDQMWLDGMYMAGPFYCEYAQMFGQPDIFDDVTFQFILVEQHTRDPKTGLLYHGWDESKNQKWARPDTGTSPHFWGRAIGWYVMALVDVLDFLPGDHPDRPALIEILQRLAAALVRYQDAASGLWYQVVEAARRTGNYRESSVSAMLAYGFAKAVRKGYLPPEYLFPARRAYRGLLENMIRIDARGVLTLEGTCSVAGLGGDPYRDGSYEYYIKEPVVANDFKGVGPFILAAIELETADVEMPDAH